MPKRKQDLRFKIRKVTVGDIKQVYPLLVANKPLVGLNSRYTYFLLARDFSDTCLVAENHGKIVAFSSGYVPPKRQETFFNWETVVHPDYRGNGLQKRLLLEQIRMANVPFLEATVNPSNEASKRSFTKLAKMLNTGLVKRLLFSEEDFENDGHEAEVLYRIGPISEDDLQKLLGSF